MTPNRGEEGAILITVLLVLAVVAGIAAALAGLQRGAVAALRGEDAAFRREVALRSALAELGARLATAPGTVPRQGQDIALGQAGALVTARVQAVSGLVNANSAAPVLLAGLFRACGTAPDAAEALAATLAARRRDAAFAAVAEVTAEIAPPLRACVAAGLTVWGAAEMLDPDTAPPEALLAVPGMTPEAATALIAARETPEWTTQGRAQAETLYRPFLSGRDTGLYTLRFRIGADRLETAALGMIGPEGQFHLIGLDWPESQGRTVE